MAIAVIGAFAFLAKGTMTMSEHAEPTYLAVKTNCAPKLGRNGGGITYKVLTAPERQHLFLAIVGNDGGGYYSREIVAFDAVEGCLPADQTQPLAAKTFASAFVGRSSNNPGFMAAILRAEGLLAGVEGKPHLHQLVGEWGAWKVAMLALPGDPYVPPVMEAHTSGSPVEITRQEMPGDDESEEHRGRRKGKKVRGIKPVEGAEHAHPA